MNHFYQTIPGWFDFHDIYTSAVNRAEDGARFLEIGTFMGKSLAYLATEIVNSRKDIELYSIDNCEVVAMPLETTDTAEMQTRERWQGRGHAWILSENLLPAVSEGLKWHHQTADSLFAAKDYADESLDFIFLDTIHTYHVTLAEICAWWPKLKVGGRFGGHDHTPPFPGVEKACREVWGDDYYVVKSSFLKVKR